MTYAKHTIYLHVYDCTCHHKCKVGLPLQMHHFINISENLNIIWVVDQIILKVVFCIYSDTINTINTKHLLTQHMQCLLQCMQKAS